MMSCAVTVALTTPLVHTHNSLISGTDVVDILQVVDAEWDQGQAAEPKPKCSDEIIPHTIQVRSPAQYSSTVVTCCPKLSVIVTGKSWKIVVCTTTGWAVSTVLTAADCWAWGKET